MAKSYVPSFAEKYYNLVRHIKRYGDSMVNYLNANQVADLNYLLTHYAQNWATIIWRQDR